MTAKPLGADKGFVSKNEDKQFDVIVIGSGIGGLTAALTAARRERRVLVLEAGKQFGGYLNPFKRRAYEFDPGLHYIGECGPSGQMTRLMERLGLGDAVRFRELSPDGFDRLVFPGYSVSTPRGVDAYRERLKLDFPHETRGLDKFFDLVVSFRAAAKALDRAKSPASVFSILPHAPMLLKYLRSTYSELLDEIISDPLLKAVLAGQGGDIGLPPGKAAALVGLGLLDHYLGGAYYPVGGSRAMRDALVNGIRQKGGELLRNHAVSRIVLENGHVTGVICKNEEQFFAPKIISNADAVVTYRDLVGTSNMPRQLRDKTRKTKASFGSICLFLGTDLDVAAAGMTDANIWHYPTIDLDRAYEPLFRGQMPDEGFFFLSSPSLKDPDTHHGAPPGHHTLEMVTLVPFEPFEKFAGMPTKKRGEEYEKLKQALAEQYIAQAEKFVPGLSSHLTVSEVGTPATNVTYAAAPEGSIYGPANTPDQFGPFRFGTESPIAGLYLAGASVLGCGIVPSALSGYRAGKMATTEKRGIWSRLMG